MEDTRTRVLFLNPHGEDLLQYLRKGLGKRSIDLVIPPDRERNSLLPLLPAADILIGWGSDSEILEQAHKAKLFINPGTGISQHIKLFQEIKKSRDITLVNGHGNSYAVAQHTLALLFSLTNKVIPHHLKMKEQTQPSGNTRSMYLKNKVVGFLGYGAINTKVHRFLSGFQLQFAAYKRDWSKLGPPAPTELKEFSGDELGDFFQHCDVVINSLPTTEQTRNMVTLKELTHLGKDGFFINVGRAATVVQEDMYRALKESIIGGAAIEVWWGRGPKPEEGRHDPYQFPFHELDNLIMSPHRAADSGGDLDRWEEVIENLIRFHDGRTDFLNIVNVELEY